MTMDRRIEWLNLSTFLCSSVTDNQRLFPETLVIILRLLPMPDRCLLEAFFRHFLFVIGDNIGAKL